MTGTNARRKIETLKRGGWTEPEIAAALSLRSTDTFRKWKTSDPLPATAKRLAALKTRRPK